MPRQARLDAPGALHRVMGRGIERTKIFSNDTDRNDFVDRLATLCRKGHLAMVLAYFGQQRRRAIQRYEAFVREGIAQGRRPELVWGDLIRSLGVTTSAVNRLAVSHELPEFRKYLKAL